MKASNIIDFADCIIQLFFEMLDIDQLDTNISIGMICRIFFFIVAIGIRDLTTYTWSEFVFQVIAWLCFHGFIIFYEMSYFVSGTSKTEQREKNYKVVDIIQSTIGMIYLSLNKESIYDEMFLFILVCNISINVIGMLISKCQKNKKPNYDKVGGVKHISLGILFGTISVIIYLFAINSKYEQEINASSTLKGYLFVTIIGEIVAALVSFCFCCSSFKKYTFTNDGSKMILGILYGINFGLFSLFYGFLIGITIIIGFLILCCGGCRESSEVHTTI